MLGGLAMKKRWQEARKAAGKDHFHPNMVFGANAQVAIEKFARSVSFFLSCLRSVLNDGRLLRYWDVEARLVPVKVEGDYVMDPHDAIKLIDENTIGVIV
jgi:glutamate decarboxylase